jgi:hypothetical protein
MDFATVIFLQSKVISLASPPPDWRSMNTNACILLDIYYNLIGHGEMVRRSSFSLPVANTDSIYI